MKVKLTVYKNILCINTINPNEEHPDFIPNGDGRIGCMLTKTNENLGASKEAIEWLKNISKSRDAIGDVMAFENCFGWLGGVYSAKKSSGISGDRDYDPCHLTYIEIPNDPDPEWMKTIDVILEKTQNE